MGVLLSLLSALTWAAPEPADFTAIDQHALAAPAAVERSIASLAAYLVQPAQTETERARSLFRWVTDRIAYDAASFFAGATLDCRPETVLRTRLTVCSGYANLFAALCQSAGLESVVIAGWGKGIGDRPPDLAGKTNHSWNAIRLDGRWHLLDCTWAAGHIGGDRRFVEAFEPFYWLADPAALSYTHYPQDPRWQLLEPPVPAAQFLARVKPWPAFWRLGLRFASHTDQVIRTADSVVVRVAIPDDTEATGWLAQHSQFVTEPCCFAQREGQEVVVRACFPTAGTYQLSVGAKPMAATEMEPAVTYDVVAQAGVGDRQRCPRQFSNFVPRAVRLYAPFDGVLAAGRPVRFDLELPGAVKAMIASGPTQTMLKFDQGRFVADVTPQPGELNLFVWYEDTGAYEGVLQYQVR